MSFSGGCQCGAIRFRAEALGSASICHCRMCQKAMGGFYGPFVTVKAEHLTWTRGAPAHFQSSNKVSRGFCTACGTPLTFEQVAGQTELAIGAFDDPAAIRPKGQLGSPRRMPWIGELGDLPMREPQEPKIAAYQADLVSYQHPDQDTDAWPPAGDGLPASR